MSIRVGMAQMLVEGGKPDANLARAIAMIADALAKGCDIVVLPECLNYGWTHPSARGAAPPIPGPHSDLLASAAGLWVVAGLVESDGGRLYNAAVMISPEGESVLKHRKINELEIAHDLYSLGTSVGVAETPLGTLGLNICADNFAESLDLAGAISVMGASLLLSPCAWAVDGDHDNERDPYGQRWLDSYGRLSRERGMTVIGVSNVGWIDAGPWQGRKCIGRSLAMGPGGEVLVHGPYGVDAEALLTVDLPAFPQGRDMSRP